MSDPRDDSPASDVVVIIAAYNAAPTLGAALASIAAQTWQPGAVVVVDDGSVDDTGQVAERWRDRLPVRVIRHGSNLGLAAARRAGVANSTEALLTILDADDVWLPDHLNVLRATYERSPGLVTADALRWMPGQGLGRRTYRRSVPIPAFGQQRTGILKMNFVFIGSMFARAGYLAAGGFRDGLLGAEDWDLWIRMVRHGIPVLGTTHPTVLYRVHQAALSQGTPQLENEIRVLELAIQETHRRDERRAALIGLRSLRARLSLVRAYAYARLGRRIASRRAAVAALRGPLPVKLRASSLLIAPGVSVRLRDRLNWLPTVRLG